MLIVLVVYMQMRRKWKQLVADFCSDTTGRTKNEKVRKLEWF